MTPPRTYSAQDLREDGRVLATPARRQPDRRSFNAAPKYVVTRTLSRLEWAGSEPLSGDLEESVNALKAQGEGTIAVLGSGALVQALIENEQVDEYRLFIHRLVLGTGKRLFREYPHPLRLQFLDCMPTSTGVLLVTYVPVTAAPRS